MKSVFTSLILQLEGWAVPPVGHAVVICNTPARQMMASRHR